MPLYKLEPTLESWARRIIHIELYTEIVGGYSVSGVPAMPVIVLLVSILSLVNGHGILFDPPGRSYMSQFGFDVPENYDAAGLNCGGQQVRIYKVSHVHRLADMFYLYYNPSPLKYQNLNVK